MILHLVPDNKFLNLAIRQFEGVAPGRNRFVVISGKPELEFIKYSEAQVIPPTKALSAEFLAGLPDYEMVVLHWLDTTKMRIVIKAPAGTRFAWIGWGADYYRFIGTKLHLPQTRALMRRMEGRDALPARIARRARTLASEMLHPITKVLGRIDLFAPVLPGEFGMMEARLGRLHPRLVEWNYGSVEDDVALGPDMVLSGSNIMVGNSATPSNNHLEAFEAIAGLGVAGKVICPLSYGDFGYREEVVKAGESRFGDRFSPMRTFLPIAEYYSIIKSCSVAIMNHRRQQALGNVIFMMYIGSKVFLNRENPIYEFMSSRGAVIFPMEDLTRAGVETGLTAGQIARNREVLHAAFGKQVSDRKTLMFIRAIEEIQGQAGDSPGRHNGSRAGCRQSWDDSVVSPSARE